MITFEKFISDFLYFNSVNKSVDEPLIRCAKDLINIDNGLYLEFGVYKGESITKIKNILQTWKIFGFDSFEGLPEDWRDHYTKGFFDLYGQPPKVDENIHLIKGWFDVTIDEWLASNINCNINLLHIDCDLYSSTMTALNKLHNNITNNTLIVFDELLNYPEYKNHEIKALYEFCIDHNYGIDMLYCGGWNNEKFAIKLKK